MFENLVRKDLSPLEKARMVKKLVDSTKSGISGVSSRYGLPKSTISEWLSILTLPENIQSKVENGEISSYEAIRIARKPKLIQERIVAGADAGNLQETMSDMGVKRGAPKGLMTIRVVFNPAKKLDKQIWDRLNKKAVENGLQVAEYVRTILLKHAKR